MSTKEITLLAPEEQPMSYQKAKEYKIGSENALKIDHLKIVFEETTQYETVILKDVNLTFQKNKIYFIVGDSGSGKTTLVTHFNGLLKSKYGNLFVSNAKIYGAKKRIPNFKKLRKTVGMVFQFPEYQLFKDTLLKDVKNHIDSKNNYNGNIPIEIKITFNILFKPKFASGRLESGETVFTCAVMSEFE